MVTSTSKPPLAKPQRTVLHHCIRADPKERSVSGTWIWQTKGTAMEIRASDKGRTFSGRDDLCAGGPWHDFEYSKLEAANLAQAGACRRTIDSSRNAPTRRAADAGFLLEGVLNQWLKKLLPEKGVPGARAQADGRRCGRFAEGRHSVHDRLNVSKARRASETLSALEAGK